MSTRQPRNQTPTSQEELVSYIARSLVNDPSQVTVRRRATNTAIIVELRVAPEDMGRVIGREGRIANAMRALLRIAERRQQGPGKRVILDIM